MALNSKGDKKNSNSDNSYKDQRSGVSTHYCHCHAKPAIGGSERAGCVPGRLYRNANLNFTGLFMCWKGAPCVEPLLLPNHRKMGNYSTCGPQVMVTHMGTCSAGPLASSSSRHRTCSKRGRAGQGSPALPLHANPAATFPRTSGEEAQDRTPSTGPR